MGGDRPAVQITLHSDAPRLCSTAAISRVSTPSATTLNAVVFNAIALEALATTCHLLRIDGDNQDHVTALDGGWLLGNTLASAGHTYVQYIHDSAIVQVGSRVTRAIDFSANLNSLAGPNSFEIKSEYAYDQVGRAVSAAGDIHGDGFADLLIGANSRDTGTGRTGAS